eukprot:jgi/Botrbrau1/7945/Bobra.9_2s0103.1
MSTNDKFASTKDPHAWTSSSFGQLSLDQEHCQHKFENITLVVDLQGKPQSSEDVAEERGDTCSVPGKPDTWTPPSRRNAPSRPDVNAQAQSKELELMWRSATTRMAAWSPVESSQSFSSSRWSRRPARPSQWRGKPDHFWAFQIASPGVNAAFEAVHAALRLHSKGWEDALVDAAAAHVTLAVSQLARDDRLETAEKAMASLRQRLAAQGLLEPFPLRLRGLSSFAGRVVYLDVDGGPDRERLMRLAREVRRHLADHDLLGEASSDDDFIPHITVAKSSKLGFNNKRKRPAIPEEAYETLLEIDGGRVLVEELQLCRMGGRLPEQYYHVHQRLSLKPEVEQL